MRISRSVHANSRDAASCASRRQPRSALAFQERPRRKENRRSNVGGQADQTSKTAQDGRRLHEATVPFPGRIAHQVPGRFQSSNGQLRQTPRLPRDAADGSQTGDSARPCQRFFQRHTLDPARFNVGDAPGRFCLPCGGNGRVHAPVSRDENAINQFRHDLNRHFASFVNDLIQCDRHGVSLARGMNFDKGQAEDEDKTSETIIQNIFNELPVP